MPSTHSQENNIAFNVNVYDKMLELQILVSILRQEFGDEAFINVTCNDDNKSPKDFRRLEIDNYLHGSRFTLPKFDEDTKTKFRNPDLTSPDSFERKLISIRRIEQLTTGVSYCANQSNAPYTVNLHADAWPLDRDGLERILSKLRKSGRPFGSRGFGYGYTSPERYPHGAIHDIFFIAENKSIRETSVLEFDPGNLALADPNTHGTIASMIQFRQGADGILWYSDLTNTLGWDGEPKLIAPNTAMRPLTYEPETALFHVNKHFFPEDFGERFMSKYLIDHGFRSGAAIESHIDDHPPGEDLVMEYEEYLRSHPSLRLMSRAKRHNANARQFIERYSELTAAGRLVYRGKQHLLNFLDSHPKLIANMCKPANVVCSVNRPNLVDRYMGNMVFFQEVERQLGSDSAIPGIIEFDIVSRDETWSRTFVGSDLSPDAERDSG